MLDLEGSLVSRTLLGCVWLNRPQRQGEGCLDRVPKHPRARRAVKGRVVLTLQNDADLMPA